MKITKNLIALIAITGMAVFLAGCNSTKDIEPVPSDSYSDSETIDSIEEDDDAEKIEAERDANNQTAAPKKKKNGFVEGITNFFASKFYEYDNTTLFTAGTFGGIKQQNAITVVYPKTGKAGFGSPIMAAYYYVTFDADARKKLEKAVNQYLSDFENKKLDRKSKKSFKAYGSVKAELYWGTVKTSSPNTAEDSLLLGYRFEGNSPYFTIYMYPTTNKLYTGPDCNYTEKSITLSYYFTKAQAQSLVNLLSDEKVYDALYRYEMDEYGIPEKSDDYYDDDEIEDDIDEVADVPEEVSELPDVEEVEDAAEITEEE